MADTVDDRRGVRVLACAPDGARLATDQDAVDLIGRTYGLGVELVVVPAERLADGFFTFDTRIAGDVIQKFVNYRVRLAIVGDISRHLGESSALRAFVRESNRGRQVWFVTDLAELDSRLDRERDSRQG